MERNDVFRGAGGGGVVSKTGRLAGKLLYGGGNEWLYNVVFNCVQASFGKKEVEERVTVTADRGKMYFMHGH